MKFSSSTIAAAALVVASQQAMLVDAWACGPSFYGLATTTRPMVALTPEEFMARKQKIRAKRQERFQKMQDAFASSMTTMTPRYEVVNNPTKFQVAVDVPGVKMQDMDITVEDDGTVLSIYGERKSWDESKTFISKFAKSFSLDETIEVEKITATLQNGVLTVSAPKKETKPIEENVRKITIVEVEDDTSSSATKDGEEVAKEEVDVVVAAEEAQADDVDDKKDVPPEDSLASDENKESDSPSTK